MMRVDFQKYTEVMELIKKVAEEKKCVVIVVVHDLILVSRYCSQVILLKDGTIFASGTPKETITEKKSGKCVWNQSKDYGDRTWTGGASTP